MMETNLDTAISLLNRGLQDQIESQIKAEIQPIVNDIVTNAARKIAQQLKSNISSLYRVDKGSYQINLVINNKEVSI